MECVCNGSTIFWERKRERERERAFIRIGIGSILVIYSIRVSSFCHFSSSFFFFTSYYRIISLFSLQILTLECEYYRVSIFIFVVFVFVISAQSNCSYGVEIRSVKSMFILSVMLIEGETNGKWMFWGISNSANFCLNWQEIFSQLLLHLRYQNALFQCWSKENNGKSMSNSVLYK